MHLELSKSGPDLSRATQRYSELLRVARKKSGEKTNPMNNMEKKLLRANQRAMGGLDPATLFSQVSNLITLANQLLSRTGLRAAVVFLTNKMSIAKF